MMKPPNFPSMPGDRELLSTA
ncbi:MAG: hypothetical protein RLZ37_297, partial [Actinomycetota bacterium]